MMSDPLGVEPELRPVVAAIQHFLIATTRQSMELWLQLELTMPQFAALQAIWRLGPISGRQLAEQLDISQPAVVKVCDRLEARGLIERVRDKVDRRVQWLQLSATGLSALDNLVSINRQHVRPALQHLSARDRRTLTRVLNELAASIEETRHGVHLKQH